MYKRAINGNKPIIDSPLKAYSTISVDEKVL